MRISTIIGLLCLLPVCLLISSCGEHENRPPILTEINITPQLPAYTGHVLSLQASGTDPDGDVIEYIWSAVDSRNVNVTDEVFVERSGIAVQFKADVPDTYFITVIATDTDGLEGSLSLPLVILAGDNPIISILSPKSGAVVQGNVSITVEANDDKGVIRVDFYIDGDLVAQKTSSPFSHSWDTAGMPGDHVIAAKAFDSDGNSGDSKSVVVTVQDMSGVMIEITNPANGDQVDWVTTVEGTAEGVPEGQHVWLFVNPHTVGQWYPQNPPTVTVDGDWKALCYFGREGEDQGVQFDIGIILVDDDEVQTLLEELAGGDIKPRFLFDPILTLTTVTRR